MFFFSLLSFLPMVTVCQVGFDLGLDYDLLALESERDVAPVVVLPPPGFEPSGDTGVASGASSSTRGVDGSYSFSYKTPNGMEREEEGSFSGPDGGFTVKGRYSYLGPDGVTYTVNFVADKNGYRPR